MGNEGIDVLADAASERTAGNRLEHVMQVYETDLLRYAARLMNDIASAQDIVQLVFLRYVDSCERVTLKAAAVKAWLYRVTHNLAVDHLRREQRLRRLHTDGAEYIDQQRQAAKQTHALHAERQQRVLDMLPRLPLPEREALILRLQQGLSYREIAHATGRTEGNVGCLLHHAVTKMAQLCRENEEPS